MSVSRRKFLRSIGLVGASVSVPGVWRLLSPDRIARAAPKPTGGRQWAMVIDLRKCEGCRTIDTPPACTTACNTAHHLNPDQPWIPVYEVEGASGGTYFQPTPCMHCENAPCVRVCPVGATFQNDSGVVLIDQGVCLGCRMCMAACPYGARTFNWTDPGVPEGMTLEDYTPETSVPQRRGTVGKCMMCAHLAIKGELPACASGCPMFAIYFADLTENVATNGKEVVNLTTLLTENHAYQLKPEFGTKPRVWYIPGHGEAFGREMK